MPDDQNTSQNQEPTEQSTEKTAHSEPVDAPSEVLESSPRDFDVNRF